MRLSRTAAVVGATLMIGGLSTTALAAGSLSKTNILPAGETVTVTWSGLAPAQGPIYLQQCSKSDADPTFNRLVDCSGLTGVNNANFVASGSLQFPLFGGDEPNLGEWGCGALTSPGIPRFNTCYVRLAPGNQANTSADEFYPFTLTGVTPPPDVPEVPLNVLLPASAAAVLGGALLIARKRQLNNAA